MGALVPRSDVHVWYTDCESAGAGGGSGIQCAAVPYTGHVRLYVVALEGHVMLKIGWALVYA